MPAYDVLHSIHLSDSQKDALAEAITRTHADKFITPRIFVNVAFTNIEEARYYSAGKRRSPMNHIRGWTRAGPSRTQEDWDGITQALSKAWHDIAGHSESARLRTVSIFAGVSAALEEGFSVPVAGQDVPWLYENWDAFEERADHGSEEFKEMMAEVQERGLVKF